MKFLKILNLFFILVLAGCNDDLVINADYKDITIVYGLLNLNDSIHYIKISKAFLNKNNDAVLIAKNPDSLYYKDSLRVVLDEYKNGSLTRSIYLYKIYNTDKDSGIFSWPGQYLYCTPVTKLDPIAVYVLTITNMQSGKVMKSQATMVNDFSTSRPVEGGLITFNPSTKYDIIWYSGKNAYFYDLTIKISYKEYYIQNPSVITTKTLTWPIFTFHRTSNLTGNEKMSVQLNGATFYDFLASNIKEDINIQREFGDVEFDYAAGGEEIFYYINVNRPTVGTVQKKPEYTNIENGYGVFSSRNMQKVMVKLSPLTVSEVKTNTKTMNLNFIK